MGNGRLGRVLAELLGSEPPVGRGVADIYARAEVVRRRRLKLVLVISAVAAMLVAALGYVVTAVVVPDTVRRSAGFGVAGPAPADPVLTILRKAAGPGLRIFPRAPARGAGWRLYSVLGRTSGLPRGLIEMSVYDAPAGLCFPVLADPRACARPGLAGLDIEYARYADARDVDWQVYQTMARRLSDGRVLTVMATGERGTGNAYAGRPSLTVRQTASLATDGVLISAFSPDENCDGPDPDCPLLKVPVPNR